MEDPNQLNILLRYCTEEQNTQEANCILLLSKIFEVFLNTPLPPCFMVSTARITHRLLGGREKWGGPPTKRKRVKVLLKNMSTKKQHFFREIGLSAGSPNSNNVLTKSIMLNTVHQMFMIVRLYICTVHYIQPWLNSSLVKPL